MWKLSSDLLVESQANISIYLLNINKGILGIWHIYYNIVFNLKTFS